MRGRGVCHAVHRRAVYSPRTHEDGGVAPLACVRGPPMARLTKPHAARQLGIARATLSKLLAQGQVSSTPDGLIDQAALVRVAPDIDTSHERSRTATDA